MRLEPVACSNIVISACLASSLDVFVVVVFWRDTEWG